MKPFLNGKLGDGLCISLLGLGVAQTTNLFSHSAGGCRVQDQGVHSVALFEAPLLAWLVDGCLFPFSFHNLPSVCVCVQIPSSYKYTKQIV